VCQSAPSVFAGAAWVERRFASSEKLIKACPEVKRAKPKNFAMGIREFVDPGRPTQVVSALWKRRADRRSSA
jgi:hypothetical protein